CAAERAALITRARYFISVLSAGDDLQRDRRTGRRRGLRHRLMRHFLRRKVGEAIAIARLPGRLQKPAASLGPIRGAGTPHRVPPLIGSADAAETPPSITASAETKLNATPSANDDPKILRPQSAPNRRLLDMEL